MKREVYIYRNGTVFTRIIVALPLVYFPLYWGTIMELCKGLSIISWKEWKEDVPVILNPKVLIHQLIR